MSTHGEGAVAPVTSARRAHGDGAGAAVTGARVTYGRLMPLAKFEIQGYGWTVAGYIRRWFPDGVWGGDRCGCPDDRCRDGYHHERWEDCGCLVALLMSESPREVVMS